MYICLFDFMSAKSNTVCTAICVSIINKISDKCIVCVVYVIVGKYS